jgi:hypothetical protein
VIPRARLRLALAALALALVLAAGARAADAGKTWCVSAFEEGPAMRGEGGAMTERDPCADACFKGSSWHFHGFVQKGGSCFSCWDESDNTCQDAADDEGYAWIGFGSCGGFPIASYNDDDQGCYPDTPPQPQPDPGATTTQPDPGNATPPAAIPDAAPAKIVMSKPPPPKPTDYEGVIVKLSPGPHAVNTPITATGGAQTVNGKKLRRVQNGDFVVLGADGNPLRDGAGKELRFHGKPKGRNVIAQITIPAGVNGSVTLRFEPKVIITASSEKVAKIIPVDQTIAVAGCRVQAALDAPTAGEILVADAVAQLRGHLIDAAGQPAPPTALAGARPVFVVEIAGEEQRVDATVDAGGAATGSIKIARPQADVEAVHVRLVADGGQGDVCPSAAVEAKTTALGVGIEIKPDPRPDGSPRQCYVDRKCPVTARFRLPADPTARALGQRFIQSAGLTMTAAAGGPPTALHSDRPTDVDGVWKGEITPGDVGLISLAAVAKSAGGEVTDQSIIDVMEPIELRLPAQLDLGTVPAGSAANDDRYCQWLDFSKSRGVRYQEFRVTATAPRGCDSYPVFFDGASGIGYGPHKKPVQFELGDAQRVRICLADVPRCASESPAPTTFTVVAVSPDFADQKADVELRWKVSGRSFLACWWWLIAATGGTLFVATVGYGFIRPWRFAVDDQVQLAGKREQLARAVGRRLRDLPGGRPGWYRSAAVGLLDNGQATAKVGAALVELHARKGEVIIRSRGGLERVSPQTKKMVPVPEAATRDGHVASKNVVYSAGSLFFQIK